MKKAVYVLLMLAVLTVFCGCSESNERRHPLYQKALKAQNSGNGSDAALYFEELLKRRPDYVHVHLRLATIYDELLNDPFLAVYHYRKYLAAAPDAPDADEVNAWQVNAEKRCYEQYKNKFASNTGTAAALTAVPDSPATVPETEIAAPAEPAPAEPASAEIGTPPDQQQTAAAAPAAELAAIQAENENLRHQLSLYQARHKMMILELTKLRKIHAVKTPENAAPEPPASSLAGSMKKYQVVNGDTPAKIAYKVYGKSSLFPVIMRANPHIDARKLRPGMILNIPALP